MSDHPPARWKLSPRSRRLVVLGISLVAGGFAAWATGREVRLRRDIDAARNAVEARRFDGAEPALRRWLAARPNSGEAQLLAARIDLARGRPQEAIQALDRARSLGHDRASVDRLRAIILAGAGRHDEAEPILRRHYARTTSPDPEVGEALASIYIQAYRLPQAEAVLERWAREAPADPKPWLWRARIDRGTANDAARRVEDYREALRRDPDSLEAQLGLAETLRLSSRFDEARSAFEAYLARKPDDGAAHLGLARTALVMGDEPTAIRHLDRALALDPKDSESLLERSGIDIRRAAWPEALARLDRAVELDPFDPDIRHRRALVLDRLDRRDEAKAERSLESRLRAEHAEMVEVRRKLSQAPRDRRLRLDAARWMIEHGRGEEGAEWARLVLRDFPNDLDALRLLADYHARRGDAGLANYYRLQAEKAAEKGS